MTEHEAQMGTVFGWAPPVWQFNNRRLTHNEGRAKKSCGRTQSTEALSSGAADAYGRVNKAMFLTGIQAVTRGVWVGGLGVGWGSAALFTACVPNARALDLQPSRRRSAQNNVGRGSAFASRCLHLNVCVTRPQSLDLERECIHRHAHVA